MISVGCPCGKSLRVKEEFAGRKVRCPACSQPLAIPAAEAEFAEPLEEEWDETPEEEPAPPPKRGIKKSKPDKTKPRKSEGLFKRSFKMVFGVLALFLGLVMAGWIVFAVLTGRAEARTLRGLGFAALLIGMGFAWVKGEQFGE